MEYTFHPAACLFPLIEGDEFKELAASIKKHGQQEPIYVLGNEILDGRNRLRACKEAGVEPWIANAQLEGLTPFEFSIARNFTRRHLNESQRAMVGARIREHFQGQAKARQKTGRPKSGSKKVVENFPPVISGKARDQAGKAVKVSGKTVDKATKVLEKGAPELVKAVDEGKVSVSKAAKIADQPKEQQPQAIAEALAAKADPKPKSQSQPKPAKGKQKVSVAKLCDTFMQNYGRNLTRDLDAIADAGEGRGHYWEKGTAALDMLFAMIRAMREAAQ